eukprot:8296-Heterococcus_DN1.PRE.2
MSHVLSSACVCFVFAVQHSSLVWIYACVPKAAALAAFCCPSYRHHQISIALSDASLSLTHKSSSNASTTTAC